jgi:hypothetical protein
VEVTPAQLYTGTIAGAKARILLSSDKESVRGFLFYEKTGVPFWVEGVQKGDSLLLDEFLNEESFTYSNLDNSQCTGRLKLIRQGQDELRGSWISPQGGSPKPIALSWSALNQPSPAKAGERILAATSQMELITWLACGFTGADPDLLWVDEMPEEGYYSGEMVSAHLVRPGEVTITQEAFPLLAHPDRQLVRINICAHKVLFATVELLPHTGRFSERQILKAEVPYDRVWSLEEPDTSFVRHRLVPICNDRLLLDLQATEGMTFTVSRGSDVFRFVAEGADDGWKELVSFQQHSYWYNSPCPQPIALPVEATAEYKTMPGDSLPSMLEITRI